MERYFLGSNTAYGFVGNYESELKNKRKVILLKGGPGTGKSSILKKIAAEAKNRGLDFELWYCSGDPDSLDGVYIKQLDTAVVDATAPHASGADLPKIKDFIYDLAQSLSHEKLAKNKNEIQKLLDCKKWHFMRAYQHLKVALCHLHNQIELESIGLKTADIRAYASVMASELRSAKKDLLPTRKVFTNAVCPSGENVYYDYLRDKRIYCVTGNAAAKKIFFEQLCALIDGGMVILNSIDPNIVDGFVYSDYAVVSDVGHFAGEVCESVNLSVYESGNRDGAEEERNNVKLYVAFAVEHLEKARENHIAAEQYFIKAMDFANNNRLYADIFRDVFGDNKTY